MSLQDLGLKTRNRVGVLETAIGFAVDFFFPPECVLILWDIVSFAHVDVLHRAI